MAQTAKCPVEFPPRAFEFPPASLVHRCEEDITEENLEDVAKNGALVVMNKELVSSSNWVAFTTPRLLFQAKQSHLSKPSKSQNEV